MKLRIKQHNSKGVDGQIANNFNVLHCLFFFVRGVDL